LKVVPIVVTGKQPCPSLVVHGLPEAAASLVKGPDAHRQGNVSHVGGDEHLLTSPFCSRIDCGRSELAEGHAICVIVRHAAIWVEIQVLIALFEVTTIGVASM
jgi:hypothetical protein